jgi:hypothetical protein
LAIHYRLIRAKPEHPKVIVRGQSSEFDGSSSTPTGKIKKYKWTLAPKDCPDGPGKWTTDEQKFTAQILCPMTVALEVSDGDKKDRRETTVAVTARSWKTETRRAPDEKSMSFVSALMEFGKNRCQHKDHFQENPGDFIHFADGEPVTWLNEAYWPQQVTGEGPFSGYWYVDSNKVQLVRKEFINSRLVDDTSTVYRLNAENRNLNDLKLIVQQARMHERIHSDLMMEALNQAGDPAVEIEPLLHRDPNELQKKADDMIRTVNTEIAKATTEEKVKARLRDIPQFDGKGACIFTADAEKICFPDVADIGDAGTNSP